MARVESARKSRLYMFAFVLAANSVLPLPSATPNLAATLQSHATGEIDMPQLGKCFTPRQLANEKLWLLKYTGAIIGFIWGIPSQAIDLAIY